MTDPAVSPFDLIREVFPRAIYAHTGQYLGRRSVTQAKLRAAEEALDQLQRDHEALAAGVRHGKTYTCAEADEALVALKAKLDAAVREAETLREALRATHEFKCGCDRPGNPAACVGVPLESYAALASSRGEQGQT